MANEEVTRPATRVEMFVILFCGLFDSGIDGNQDDDKIGRTRGNQPHTGGTRQWQLRK